MCVTSSSKEDLIHLLGSFFYIFYFPLSNIIRSYALGQNYRFKRGSSQGVRIFSVLHQSTGNVKKLGTHYSEHFSFTGSKQSIKQSLSSIVLKLDKKGVKREAETVNR